MQVILPCPVTRPAAASDTARPPEAALIARRIESHRKWARRRLRLRLVALMLGRRKRDAERDRTPAKARLPA